MYSGNTYNGLDDLINYALDNKDKDWFYHLTELKNNKQIKEQVDYIVNELDIDEIRINPGDYIKYLMNLLADEEFNTVENLLQHLNRSDITAEERMAVYYIAHFVNVMKILYNKQKD